MNPIKSTLEYSHTDELTFDADIIPTINKYFSELSDYSTTKQETSETNSEITFYCKDSIRREHCDFLLKISVEHQKNKQSKITRTEIKIQSTTSEINEYDLQTYIQNLYYKILLKKNEGAKNIYTVRIYSKIYNSHPIKGQYLLNFKYKTLLTPAAAPYKQEPNTEQIIFFDVEMTAANIEHARSLAFEHVSNIQSYLSVLVDVGFEFVDSEFRTFIFKSSPPEAPSFSTQRFRTGYFDPDLKLVVRDNLNFLSHIDDEEDFTNLFQGKVSVSFDDTLTHKKTRFNYTATKKEHLEQLFLNRKLPEHVQNPMDVYREAISKDHHLPNLEIKFPRQIRAYFTGIHRLSPDKKEAFLSCSRMYNLAIKLHRTEPTACLSYLICAVESLTIPDQGFSEFLNEFSPENYDKKLCDYYYSLRSSHFHAGKFHFRELNPSLLIETDLIFANQHKLFFDFYETMRATIVNWLETYILPKP
ncbi:hypothetical protein [Pseudomonas sp. Marseille-Q1929]|uniref:hypothetical protein n=1 Tax=Pseudomonas sp. Marseille-Q1929 TaxID=2730402 RepID=UPI001A8CD02E|nr:hypothetical protein [Pseudomonas sp. Marseille-Q1929]MBO0491897.1 hypothetical protein [Pseudomonas sp. Marseille-Q1929]